MTPNSSPSPNSPSPNDTYTSPLAERNASKEMLTLWSPRHKFNTWRRIWLAVAEAQHKLGLPVSNEQVEELRAVVERPGGITDAEIELAKKYERELRHDVMAHVHALGDACPKAKGIIHLGMTSQDVVCNADFLIIHQATCLILTKIAACVSSLGAAGAKWVHVPTLGFTHYQPAQPTTVGRRITQWAHDLSLIDDSRLFSSKPRGFRGATGTQASFLALFSNDSMKVDRMDAEAAQTLKREFVLDEETGANESTIEYVTRVRDRNIRQAEAEIAKATAAGDQARSARTQSWLAEYKSRPMSQLLDEHAVGYLKEQTVQLTGQTYPRVVDTFILADLASTASVLHKIATDIRLLSNRKEIDEPFESKQIGSSAMPYKRNPMRCERICGLTRFVMNLVGNAYDTAATQWLERTLDDSSNRRLSLPEAFLALDGALDLMHNVASGLVVHEATVRKNLMAELPFMATENLLMECVKLGGDRQRYHEVIRQHAQAAGFRVKQEGAENDLIDRLKGDKNFWSTSRGGALSAELNWDGLLDPMKYVGRSVEQTERFIADVVEPLRAQYADRLAALGDSGPKV
ncbi:MAG: adenylosuccinate lyase [Planctomycetes bacterium]|nr:adenylosuccinate lyase [Planctomycetota bacterium]